MQNLTLSWCTTKKVIIVDYNRFSKFFILFVFYQKDVNPSRSDNFDVHCGKSIVLLCNS